jgi:hypothetical protein
MPRTTGSPKGSNSYGDRVPIVPRYKHILERGTEYSATNKLNVGFVETRRNISYTAPCLGIIKKNKQIFFTPGHNPDSTTLRVDLPILKKLADLNTRSHKHPEGVIDRNLYAMMLDESIFLLAYDKLTSKPGNMTAGINPTTLEGISKDPA